MLYDARRLRFAGERKKLIIKNQVGRERRHAKAATFDRKSVIEKSFLRHDQKLSAQYLTLFPQAEVGQSAPNAVSKFPRLRPKLHTRRKWTQKMIQDKRLAKASGNPARYRTESSNPEPQEPQLWGETEITPNPAPLLRSCQRHRDVAFRFRLRESEKDSTLLMRTNNSSARGRATPVSPKRPLSVSISAMDRGSASVDDTEAEAEGFSSIEELNQRILTQQQKIQQAKTRMSPGITDMDKVVTSAVLPSRLRPRVHVSGGLCRVGSAGASSNSQSPSLISGLNDIAQAMLYLGNEVDAASEAGPHVRLFA